MRRTVLIVILIIPTLLFSQRRNRYKYEWTAGIGANNFLGELGGANQVGTHGVQDWRWIQTRPAVTVGLRYKNSRYFGYKGALSFAMLSGSDANTLEPVRHNRNLSFRSPILELSLQGEFYFTKEKQGRLYRIKNTRRNKGIDLSAIQAYAFGGVGLLWFNPQAQYKGAWVNLRPLSTEGEGLPGGPKKYLPITASFPIGLGAKYTIDKIWSVGLEVGLHLTLSDYLDDVSGKYYDNKAIRDAKGDAAAYLADHQLGDTPSQSWTGQDRGHVGHKDAFVFGIINVNYKVLYRKRTRSKF